MQMYPHWNARDNYRFGTKKKKRTKREKAIEASKGLENKPITTKSNFI